MKLYIYEFSSPRRNGQNSTDKLVLGALSEYCREEKIPLQKSPVIHRPLSGKPMFEESGFHFSVSHSGNLWACLIGITPVGLDIQKKKTASWQSIACRFFTGDEKEYVEEMGEDGFWNLWVMKEAYVKYLGTTLAKGLQQYSMVENGRLRKEIDGISISLIPMNDDFYCACAWDGREDICKRSLAQNHI